MLKFLARPTLMAIAVAVSVSAQSAPPEVSRRIEQQVRSFYTIPSNVKINLSALRPSEFPNYDALTITFDGGEKKTNYEFLLSRDGKTLLRMTKLDLSKDPYAEVMKKIDVGGRPTRGRLHFRSTLLHELGTRGPGQFLIPSLFGAISPHLFFHFCLFGLLLFFSSGSRRRCCRRGRTLGEGNAKAQGTEQDSCAQCRLNSASHR